MKTKKWLLISVLVLAVLTGIAFGIRAFFAPPQRAAMPVDVRFYSATKENVPIRYEFVGDIRPAKEAKITARVTGLIIERYVSGGENVQEGQPLFKIDGSSYETNVAGMRAQLASAEVTYVRAKEDRIRYQQLLAQNAISQQSYDIAVATENQAAAQISNIRSSLENSQLNLGYTIVRAPMSGRLDVEIANAGINALAGQTVLATVSTSDPVSVQFSLSESEYLKFSRSGINFTTSPVKLVLADGSEYSEVGKITEVDRGLNQSTGTLALKAQFNNPKNLLVPSMYARVQFTGETRNDAIVIPERAIFMQLTQSFVNVINAEGKVEARPIVVGPKVDGHFVVIENGIQPGDQVIVEGLLKIALMPGTEVKGIPMTADDVRKTKSEKK